MHVSLLQILARQLAEVLLRGVCEQTYEPVSPIDITQSQQIPNKPRKYHGEKYVDHGGVLILYDNIFFNIKSTKLYR